MIQLPKDILSENRFVQVKRLEKMYGVLLSGGQAFREGNVLQNAHCLEVVLKGELRIKYGGEVQTLFPDQIQFRKRGNYQVTPSPEYNSLLLFMENEFVLSFLKEHVTIYNRQEFDHTLPPFIFSRTEFMQQNINHIVSHITNPGNYSSCNVKLTTHQILLQILAMDPSKNFVTFLKHLVDDRKIDLSYFMESYFLQQFSIREMARLSGRSVSTFKREFMEQFHSTPGRWLINRRLEYADHLLRHSHDSISEIAFTCGFESPSHFSKVYKKKFGTSPRQKKNEPIP